MSSGKKWEDWIGKGAIACPSELKFGTKIILDNIKYTCYDRGGAIVFDGKTYWIDILAKNVPYKFGEVREAILVK